MQIPFSPPDITEEEVNEVADTLRSGWLTTGPRTKELERQVAAYCGTSKAVCLNSSTACMETTLRLLGVGPGDEVITSAYTYTASASVGCHVGATLKLVDTQEHSLEMDYDKLEGAITEKTKVIIPVDIAGVICDYDRIYEIVERKKALFHPENDLQRLYGRIIILADASHSFGAVRKGVRSGAIADFSSFSFHAVKNLTTAEGGAVTWKNVPGMDEEAIYRQYMLLSLHGQSKDALAKTQLGGWEYDIVDTYYKCNMTDVHAAIGLVQMKRYNTLLKRRHEIIRRYEEGLKDLPVHGLKHEGEDYSSSGHLELIWLDGKTDEFRNQLITKMAEEGVATNVHYKPLPMHTAYKKLGFRIEDYPNAYAQFANEISLPLHTCLTDEQIDYVIDTFHKCYREVAGN
jgi:dTDP-4-amino-4,6-dideoxygalactose transaminase